MTWSRGHAARVSPAGIGSDCAARSRDWCGAQEREAFMRQASLSTQPAPVPNCTISCRTQHLEGTWPGLTAGKVRGGRAV